MHRHGYQGRKFNRETDQRRALIKSLAEALIIREEIETTLPKAKEVRVYVEKLITKAKAGDLHSRRQVISGLQTLDAAHKLVDDIAPKLAGRNSGHLRIERTYFRRGDQAQMATISFVDDLKVEVKAKPKAKTVTKAKPTTPAAKKPVARRTPAKKPAARTAGAKA
jgi:large subunit ribosomal protein L17